jgi:GntR family transcriptional repressor for pyruvate dehydrogenase complex
VVSPRRTFEVILARLEEGMASGELRPGDRLPAERELAQRFQVSRTSVREALRVLETLGVIGIRRGAENGAVLMREPENAFAAVLRLLVGLQHVALPEIMELRVMVEVWAARMVASQRDPGTLAQLEGLLLEMSSDTIDQHAFHDLDATFHVSIVRSAKNRLVNLIEASVDSAFRQIITDVALVAWDWGTTKPLLIQQHQAIFDAMATGDADRAANLVSAHVRYWGERVIGVSS